MYKKWVASSLLLIGAFLFGEEDEKIGLDTLIDSNEEIAAVDPSGQPQQKKVAKKPKQSNGHKQLEQQIQEIRIVSALGTVGAKTASGMAPIKEDLGLEVGADALYWHAKLDGTEYALRLTHVKNSTPLGGEATSISNPLKWDWGLKASLAYRFKEENWKLGAIFTYLETGNRDAVTAPSNGVLGQIKTTSIIGASAAIGARGASSRVNLHYKTLACESPL